MRKFGLLVISFLAGAATYAQQISGTVKDQQGKPIAGSTVSLLKTRDSSVVKLAASNNEGRFSFKPINS
ncbi:MAG TPA: carboxypeptidase-like regulatory domain-containing protein, partial [Chitinophagaceae bacterium]|nr:carboxypeptidase-like regulatory domain-containing protein [Chitinophagaceae bacterium]